MNCRTDPLYHNVTEYDIFGVGRRATGGGKLGLLNGRVLFKGFDERGYEVVRFLALGRPEARIEAGGALVARVGKSVLKVCKI
jgi:hypothetical protein